MNTEDLTSTKPLSDTTNVKIVPDGGIFPQIEWNSDHDRAIWNSMTEQFGIVILSISVSLSFKNAYSDKR